MEIEIPEKQSQMDFKASHVQNDKGNETMEVIEDNDFIRRWTEEEKQLLLAALKLYGSKRLEQIEKHIATKSIGEIERAIVYYRQKAQKRFDKPKNNITRYNKNLASSLTPWIEQLNKNCENQELQNNLAKAIHILSDCEHYPDVCLTENINFKAIYEAITNALQGKPLPTLNDRSCYVLKRCMMEVIEDTKTFLNPVVYADCIKIMQNPKEELFVQNTNMKDFEMTAIQTVITSLEYNPFVLPLYAMKISKPPSVLQMIEGIKDKSGE